MFLEILLGYFPYLLIQRSKVPQDHINFTQCHLCMCMFSCFKYSLHMAVRLEDGLTPVCPQQCIFTAPH